MVTTIIVVSRRCDKPSVEASTLAARVCVHAYRRPIGRRRVHEFPYGFVTDTAGDGPYTRCMTALIVAAWTLLGLALIVVALLAATLHVRARVDGIAVLAKVRLGILETSFAFPERILQMYVWRVRIVRRRLDGDEERTDRAGEAKRAKTDAPRERAPGSRGVLAKVRAVRKVRAYARIARDVVRRVRVETCEGHLRVATPDPALTGMVYGFAEGARAVLPEPHRSRVTVEANFVDDLPYGRASIAFRVRVAVLALAAWRVFWLERGRPRRGTRVAVAPGRSDHATN